MKQTLIIPVLIFLNVLSHGQVSDPEGIVKANKMIVNLGGHSAWGDARHLYVKERVFPLRVDGPIIAEFWRSYSGIGYEQVFKGPQTNRSEAWGEKSGWTVNAGVTTPMSDEDLIAEQTGSQQEPYRIYHRLGRRDSTLIIKLVGDNRLDFYETNGRHLCWFILDKNCAPVSWGNVYRGRVNQHVYGPLKPFGAVSMPAWGASVDGSFRFEYVEVKPMATDFIPPSVPRH